MSVTVSVIIPTYKRGNFFLERAIRSVLEQSYAQLEILVVDDNDPESEHRKQTEQLMHKFAAEDRVVYVRNLSNLGSARTRNVGIEKARGEYVTFLDDDDRYLPEKIAVQVAFMQTHALDMTFTDLRIHNEQDELLDYRQFQNVRDFRNEALFRYHMLHHITGTPTFMYRREVLVAFGGFDDIQLGDEFFLMLKTIQQGVKIGYLPECHVIAYIHGDEKLSSGPEKMAGERKLYLFKRRHFHHFTLRDRMYMTSRHHAVMALAARRSGSLAKTLWHLFLAVGASPVDAWNEMLAYFRRLRELRQK